MRNERKIGKAIVLGRSVTEQGVAATLMWTRRGERFVKDIIAPPSAILFRDRLEIPLGRRSDPAVFSLRDVLNEGGSPRSRKLLRQLGVEVSSASVNRRVYG